MTPANEPRNFKLPHTLLVTAVVQSLSCVRLFATPWTAAHQASRSFTISQSLLKLLSIMLVMPSSHLILCRPLLLPSIFHNIKVFSNELALRIRWPNYWSFSFSPSSEFSGLISFRIDWFGLLAVQRTPKSLLQHHNLKASILWCSAFFTRNYINKQECIYHKIIYLIWYQTKISILEKRKPRQLSSTLERLLYRQK